MELDVDKLMKLYQTNTAMLMVAQHKYILGALSECLILTDQQSNAQSLVDTYYKEKFRRYSAFRKEVKAVFNRGVLKSIGL